MKNAEVLWQLFAESGLPSVYLLYRRALEEEERAQQPDDKTA